MSNAKLLWKMMKAVAEIIIECDGTIFGGYVRDKIVHDHAADAFYEQAKMDADALYDDVSFLPKTADRILIPHDIDVFFEDCKLHAFEAEMQQNGIRLKKLFTHDNGYAGRVPKGMPQDTSHSKYRVEFVIPFLHNVMNLPTFTIDVIHSVDPLNLHHFNIDFDCNTLLMNKQGVSMATVPEVTKEDPLQRFFRMVNVIEDIKVKKTRVHTQQWDLDEHRLRAILKKGWKVHIGGSIETTFNEAYDGHYIICHNELVQESVKLTCCDAHYHLRCLDSALTLGESAMCETGKCIACRKHVMVSVGDLAKLQLL